MTIRPEVQTIIDEAINGEISIAEAHAYLDECEVRGTFTAEGFEGYDYATQEWIEVEI